jgi:signal transduction histidine kinase
MNLLNRFTIKTKTYMLVSLSVIVALALSYVSNGGLGIIKSQVDELIRANQIERYTYRTILEEKNYLLNANGSVTNHKNAQQAFENTKESLKTIYLTLDEIEQKTLSAGTSSTIADVRKAIAEYDELYKRGVYLLQELEKERIRLQSEGENITSEIQQYVEAKRVDVKKKLSAQTIEKINCGSNIWQYTYMTRADEKRYLLSPDPALIKTFDHDFGFMMSELDRLRTLSDQPYEFERIEHFNSAAVAYEEAMKNWISYNNELVFTVLPKTKVLGEKVIDETLKIADQSVKDIVEKRQAVLYSLIIMTIASIIFGLIFGSAISRSINRAIHNFQNGLLDFFKYLDRRKNSAELIPIESRDEIAMMAEVVNENIVKIEEVMEQKLQEMKEKDRQMLQQSRLAQMGEMISMIAHQWRQPLGAISATTADMEVKLFKKRQFDLGSDEGVRDMEQYSLEQLHKINGFVSHLSKTIDDFRNFFKPDKVKTSFTLQLLMERTLNLSTHLLKTKGVKIQKYYDSDLGTIYSYENEVMQVLLNIINNAVDALVENRVQEPLITVRVTTSRLGEQLVSITDNAGGIPDEIFDKIFDPYFSTKKNAGTGLGLYMSQTIIAEHCEGSIKAENVDNGAMFTIVLPTQEQRSDDV